MSGKRWISFVQWWLFLFTGIFLMLDDPESALTCGVGAIVVSAVASATPQPKEGEQSHE